MGVCGVHRMGVCVDCGDHVESKKTLEALKILICTPPGREFLPTGKVSSC